ncbi:hypothetical protein C8Q73DRAFT_827588 [Cubamyces lactineus]|nr:hypothetical protein C8Q73DRAFT_827588 [Cubamyces lactineus]
MELDVQQLRETALKVVTEIVEQGRLDAFTKKTFRKEVEQVMLLPQGTLDAPEYKGLVAQIAQDYIVEYQEAHGGDEEETVAAKKKSSRAPKKPKQTPDSAKQDTKAKPASKRPAKGKKPARSASVVPSSGDEGGNGVSVEPSTAKSKPRGKAAAKARRIETESEGSTAETSAQPPSKRLKTTPASQKEEPEAAGPSASSPQADPDRKSAQGDNDGQRSESEMSVLIDEPPARKHKKKGENGTRTAKPVKGRKRKEPAKELSKDEETIKRLKALVVACGVRKVWSKEFKGLEKPSDQIRRLRQILTDLGMSGRMSMEQAKAIKAKREFEKELEDVQEFASKVVAGPSARRRGPKDNGDKDRNQNEDKYESESESEIDTAPKRRTARQSIMAFLGDDSE